MAFKVDKTQNEEAVAGGALTGALSGAASGAAIGSAGTPVGTAVGALVGAAVGAAGGGAAAGVQDEAAQRKEYEAEQKRLKLKKQAEFDANAYAQAPGATGPSVEYMGTPSVSAGDAWRKQVYG